MHTSHSSPRYAISTQLCYCHILIMRNLNRHLGEQALSWRAIYGGKYVTNA